MQRSSEARILAAVMALFAAMDRTALLNVLREYHAALRANGAIGVYIFGSRARGEERPDSDLDLFIDYDPAVRIPNMFRLMQLEEDISRILGVPVTITTRNALHPLMKDTIERDSIRVL
jgi:predicted nucleotidyltransferase